MSACKRPCHHRRAEAEGLLVGLLATSRWARGSKHPGTLAAANNLAAAYGRQGKHTQAEELKSEVLEASRRMRGAGHPATLHAARNLASTHGHLGKHAKAAEVRVLYSQQLVGQTGEIEPSNYIPFQREKICAINRNFPFASKWA